MEKEPLSIFQEYLDKGYVIYSTLIEHPKVNDAPSFAKCSVVLQRGIIVFDGRRETLFLRSYFHSSNGKEFVNFVPDGGLRISFLTDTIWFPLELTKVIFEPASYVVLDILTPRVLNNERLPKKFKTSRATKYRSALGSYHVTRVTARLEAGRDWPDINIKP